MPSQCFIYRGNYGWRDETEWLKKHYVGGDFQGQVIRLSLLIVVYYLWRARDKVLNVKKRANKHEIEKKIVDSMRNSTANWKGVGRNMSNWNLAAEGGLSPRIFE